MAGYGSGRRGLWQWQHKRQGKGNGNGVAVAVEEAVEEAVVVKEAV